MSTNIQIRTNIVDDTTYIEVVPVKNMLLSPFLNFIKEEEDWRPNIWEAVDLGSRCGHNKFVEVAPQVWTPLDVPYCRADCISEE
jgi:hypothetical protein